MIGFGLLSVVVAALLLSRQKDVKRLFAYSSIEHMGIITFAFGMGGPIANFAGLLHMTVHSLTKSAIFFAVGHAAQKTGTQIIDDIRGLVTISPMVGWGLIIGTLAILGMPPFGVFASEFLILTTAMREQPWATPHPARGARRRVRRRVLESAADGVRRDDGRAAAAAAGDDSGVHASGTRADARTVDSALSRRLVPQRGKVDRMNVSARSVSRPPCCLRVCAHNATQVSSGQLLTACRLAWEQGARLVALWASDERDRRRGFCIRVALEDGDGLMVLEHTLPDADARYPDLDADLSRRQPDAARGVRSRRRRGRSRRPAAVALAGELADRPVPAAPRFRRAPRNGSRGQEEYAFVRVEGDGVHEIPVGPVHAGIIEPGHFRFQVVGEKVLRLEERLGYVHKGIEKRFESLPLLEGGRLAGRVSGRQHRRVCVGVCAGGRIDRRRRGRRRGPRGCARCASSASASPIIWAILALSATTAASRSASRSSRASARTCCARNARAFGHRLLMDVVVPGGVASDIACGARRMRCATNADRTRARDRRAARHLRRARRVAGSLPRLRARHAPSSHEARPARPRGPRRAASRATCAAICRARPTTRSACGWRCDDGGDVAARVAVRFDEALESLRLISAIIGGPARSAGDGRRRATFGDVAADRLALGYVEGWRGPVLVALESGPDGTVRRCHPHDPSWSQLAGARARGDR